MDVCAVLKPSKLNEPFILVSLSSVMVIVPVFSGPMSGMDPNYRIIAILAGTAVTVIIIQALRSLGTGDALKLPEGSSNDT